ncbi:CHAP domain-containing protein [bacterium]|nr:CHAP domain-containing protein [bacterium]
MVWFFLQSVPAIGTERCGNMLADIANGKRTCCGGNNTSVFTSSSDFLNPFGSVDLNQDMINPFRFYNYQTSDYSDYLNFSALAGSAYGMDLVTAPLLASQQKLMTNTKVNTNNSGNTGRQVQTAAAMTNTGYNWDIMALLSNMWNNIKTGTRYVYNAVSGGINSLVNYASSFVGRINNDSQGNATFSGGHARAWCADFVTYCVRKVLGNRLPSDFGSPAVSGLRDWGIKHNCYRQAPASRSESDMRNYLRTQVKPGDIMIQKRNGRSHTGIVKSVSPDGSSYTVVEGNASNKVKTVTYNATNGYLSGFVSLSQFA